MKLFNLKPFHCLRGLAEHGCPLPLKAYSTRCIRNSLFTSHNTKKDNDLSTPRGTLGTAHPRRAHCSYFRLSTPHGTLGTFSSLSSNDLSAFAFNSTRHIRNPTLTDLTGVWKTAFNSTRHIRNSMRFNKDQIKTITFNSTRHIRNSLHPVDEPVFALPFQLHTAH